MTTFSQKAACLTFSALLNFSAQAQYTVDSNQTAQALLDQLAGLNISVTNATLTCPWEHNGVFTYGGSILPMTDGVTLCSGRVSDIGAPSTQDISSSGFYPGDQTLSDLIGYNTMSACVLECDAIAVYDTLYLNYSFASKEYPLWNCSPYNDAFGFFITGPGFLTPTNFALVPGTDIPTAINSVNDGTVPIQSNNSQCTNMGPGSPFTQYYIDNATGNDIAFNGMTTLIEAFIVVNPGDQYHLKFVVANSVDNVNQSAVFMQGGSLSSKNAGTVNISSISKSGKTMVFPNPVRDRSFVKLPTELNNEDITVTVTSITGHTVLTYKGKGSGLNSHMKIEQMNAGSYIMDLSAEGHHEVVRFQKE